MSPNLIAALLADINTLLESAVSAQPGIEMLKWRISLAAND
jgi:hypothetical protein